MEELFFNDVIDNVQIGHLIPSMIGSDDMNSIEVLVDDTANKSEMTNQLSTST